MENPIEPIGLLHNAGLRYSAQQFSSQEVNNDLMAIVRNNSNNKDKRDSILISYGLSKSAKFAREYAIKYGNDYGNSNDIQDGIGLYDRMIDNQNKILFQIFY